MEEKTIKQLKAIGKPFVVILNSTSPTSSKTTELAQKLSDNYKCKVLPIDCQNLNNNDINKMSVMY